MVAPVLGVARGGCMEDGGGGTEDGGLKMEDGAGRYNAFGSQRGNRKQLV